MEPREALIPLDQITEPPHQLRESIDAEELGQLADNIAVEGLHQAIGLKRDETSDRYVIGYGHRRYLAHRLLGRPEIRARIYPPGTDLLDIAISENHFRKDLNPIEDARAMRQLIARGEPVPHIARKYRVSEATVRTRLALLNLPRDLQEALSRGKLTVAVALALAEIDHPEYRGSLIDEAVRTGATTRVVNVWTAHYQADRDRIVSNHLTVAEISASRATFVVYVPCDACHEEKPYGDTRARRFCADCDNQLTAALQEASRETSQPTADKT